MRLFIISATLVALAACSREDRLLAPDHEANRIVSKEHRNPKLKGLTDPVCGQPLDAAEYTWRSSHDGHDFYFDSESCKRQFDADPELYSTTAR